MKSTALAFAFLARPDDDGEGRISSYFPPAWGAISDANRILVG